LPEIPSWNSALQDFGCIRRISTVGESAETELNSQSIQLGNNVVGNAKKKQTVSNPSRVFEPLRAAATVFRLVGPGLIR